MEFGVDAYRNRTGIPAWFPKGSPLPPPRGQVIRIDTEDELLAAVDRLSPGGTILVADGRYKLPRPVVLDLKTNITLRGASGDAAQRYAHRPGVGEAEMTTTTFCISLVAKE